MNILKLSCPSLSKYLHVPLYARSITFKTKATVAAQDPVTSHDPDMSSFDHCQGHIIINMAFI